MMLRALSRLIPFPSLPFLCAGLLCLSACPADITSVGDDSACTTDADCPAGRTCAATSAGSACVTLPDAGESVSDAGGNPADAGPPLIDSGSLPGDAGPTPLDAGPVPMDAALPDSGPAAMDSGSGGDDAGPVGADASAPPSDAGLGEADAGNGCTQDIDGDEHGDGCVAGADCDDNNALRFFGNDEFCDGVDNNCDGRADEDDACPCDWFSAGDDLQPHLFCRMYAHWEEAGRYCESMQNYHFVKMETQEEVSFVRDVQFFAGGNYWLGARTISLDGGTPEMLDGAVLPPAEWADGTPVRVKGWNPGEPNNAGGRESCAIHVTGGWQDRLCQFAQANGFVCEPDVPAGYEMDACIDADGDGRGHACVLGPDCDDSDNQAWRLHYGVPDRDGDGVSTNAREWICAGDARPDEFAAGGSVGEDCDDTDGVFDLGCTCLFRYRDGKDYAFCREFMGWDEARIRCNEVLPGSDLFISEDLDELSWASRQMWPIYTGDWWIGATDVAAEGDWRWLDDATVDQSLFSPNQPNNNNGNEHCAEFDPNDNGWNDDGCGDNQYFICSSN
jgi:hypothetical protein